MNKIFIITALLALVLMLTSCHQSTQKAGTEKQVDSTETSSMAFPSRHTDRHKHINVEPFKLKQAMSP
jgi:PBP1b-binding outer membrane lipoprotein LpoB